MYSEDQHKNSGIKELITTIAEYLMNMVEVEFIKIAFRKHNKKYKNSKVVISLLRVIFNKKILVLIVKRLLNLF